MEVKRPTTRDEAIEYLVAAGTSLRETTAEYDEVFGLVLFDTHKISKNRAAARIIDEIVELLPDMESLYQDAVDSSLPYDQWRGLSETIQVYMNLIWLNDQLGDWIETLAYYLFTPYWELYGRIK